MNVSTLKIVFKCQRIGEFHILPQFFSRSRLLVCTPIHWITTDISTVCVPRKTVLENLVARNK